MDNNKSLDESILIAQEDIHIRNKLIEQYKPFVASTVQKRVGHFVEYGRDEELSIALMAFNEAIEHYDRSKGTFLSFAKVVISRRLIDYQRKKEHYDKGIIIEKHDEEKTIELYDKKSIEAFKRKSENQSRQLEIEQYRQELQQWGLDFSKLAKHSPKHKRTRKLYKEIASSVMDDEELLAYMWHNKRLPIQKIVDKLKVHRKKIERGRIYIIALIIIRLGDYQYLKEYI